MSNRNNQESRKKHDLEFKADVLKMVESGHPMHEIAQSLGLRENLIYQWHLRSRASKNRIEAPTESN